jgi:hypothetical protein
MHPTHVPSIDGYTPVGASAALVADHTDSCWWLATGQVLLDCVGASLPQAQHPRQAQRHLAPMSFKTYAVVAQV